ncbi:MAG: hypothetical protein R3A52_22490 [Polyangiales bacterium]
MKTRPAAREPSPDESVDPVAAARAAACLTNDSHEAFEHFRPLAEAVPTKGLAPLNSSPFLMLANVKAALRLLEPHLGAVVATLHDPPLREVFELPSLLLALGFAARRAPARPRSTGEIARLLAEGRPLREATLHYLEVASHPVVKLVPAERVCAVREGSGNLDLAMDFMAIAMIFREYRDALAGKHPFSDATLDRLNAIGSALYQRVRPGNAIAPARKRAPEAVLRDQLAALVDARYDQLLVMASAALGPREVAERFPALRSASYPAKPAPKPAGQPSG